MIQSAPLIKDVARYLSEYDSSGNSEHNFRESSQEDLMSYFRLAVQQLVAADPKAFVKPIRVQTPADGLLQLPPECEECLGVLRYIGADGKTIDRPPYSDNAKFNTTRPVCGAVAAGSASVNIARDDIDRRSLFITPATAGGAVVLSCVSVPDMAGLDTTIDIPSKHYAAIFNFMVSYAYGVDIESSPMRNRSDEHWQRATALVAGGAAKAKTK